LLAFALVACGGASGGVPAATTETASTADTTSAASGPAPSAGTSAAAGWTTYGGSASRSGIAPGAPANPNLRRRFARSLDADVYAQPLIAGGRIYVATENNSVYAFTTGGKLVWHRNLGAPVPGGDLPCGNINPSGITGTPVIAAGRIYVVAALRAGHKHVLFGLRLGSGSTAVRTRVDPTNPLVQQ